MADENQSTMLQILQEKDKLIVSLKESQTKRDKLNEQQILILSQDNQVKQEQIKAFDKDIKDLRFDVLKKDSEISIYKITNEKITDKLEKLKGEIGVYRQSINNDLQQLKLSLDKELKEKEALHQIISTDLKATITKLEAKLCEVEDHYVNIIKNISEKQGRAKLNIREALDRLQDALALLDLGNLEIYRPKQIVEEFGQIVDTAKRDSLGREEEIRKSGSGNTVIENIENVNVKLMSTPQIESLFSDISTLQTTAAEELDNVGNSGGAERQGAGNGSGAGSGTGGSSQKSGSPAGGGADGKSQQQPGNQAGAGAGAQSRQPGSQAGAGAGAGVQPQQRMMMQGSGDGSKRTILDKDNFAPFDWQKILGDMQLKKYAALVKSCDIAINAGDYTRAIKLFQTIRDQPGIQDAKVAGKMIDEEIIYLEKIIKDRYTKKT